MIDLRLVSSLPIKWQRSKCACLALTRAQESSLSLSKICYMAKCSSNKRGLDGAAFCFLFFFPIPVFLLFLSFLF